MIKEISGSEVKTMQLDKDALKKILSEHGLKASEQRIQILDFLNKAESHPTADEIFRSLNPEDPVLSRATVYNTLNRFVEKGVISALDLSGHETRYDLITHEHGHFRCKICGTIYNFELDPHQLSMELPGFTVEGLSVTLRGICPDCQAKANQPAADASFK